MERKISKLIVARRRGDRITMELVDMPPLEDLRQEACERYMNGDMAEDEFIHWMQIFAEMEESLKLPLPQIGNWGYLYLRNRFTELEVKTWNKAMKELSDLDNQKEDQYATF